MAFCIYPSNDDLQDQVSLFLDALGSTYESSRLGSHIRLTQLGRFSRGLVPVPFPDRSTFQDAVRSIRQMCVELGKILRSTNWQAAKSSGPEEFSHIDIDNLVIYMVNPFGTGRGISELSSAFWMLYQIYVVQAPNPHGLQQDKPDIVLQILPIEHIALSSTVVIPEPIFLQKLAREVYDRCPPAKAETAPSALKISSGSSIQLEQTPHKSIQFKLVADPPSDIMHENSHFHLGYAKSANGEWITAAWTDNAGRYQATVSYCTLGRTFFEVAREIWQTSLEVMLGRRVLWRFCIAKVGTMEREELDGKSYIVLLCPIQWNSADIEL
jgi:mediator of RNA polymerase II transcription subunit 13